MIDLLQRWWRWVAAALAGAIAAIAVPASAWANTAAGGVVVEVVKKKPKIKGAGSVGVCTLCCLVVVAAIVIGIVYLIKRKRS